MRHPFGCPAGDGGSCSLPNPPIGVVDGKVRIVRVDADGASNEPLNPDGLTSIEGARRASLLQAIKSPGTPADISDGMLVTCTCGHMYLAGNAT